MVDAVDDDADPQVLPGPVAGPLEAGTDQHRRRFGRLGVDALDPPAQLARRPERVDQLEIVVGSSGVNSERTACSALRRSGGTFGGAPRSAID